MVIVNWTEPCELSYLIKNDGWINGRHEIINPSQKHKKDLLMIPKYTNVSLYDENVFLVIVVCNMIIENTTKIVMLICLCRVYLFNRAHSQK